MRICSMPLVTLLVLATACGNGSGKSTSTPAVSGAYEFVVTSDVTGGVTLVEADFTANGNQSSAVGPSQVQILTLENKNWYVNGVCPGAMPGQNSLATNINGNNVALTFNEGGNALPGQGVLTGATITGNYSISDSQCPDLVGEIVYPPGYDFGGFVGSLVPELTGAFSGSLNLPDGTDNAALTLSEGANNTLTVSAQLNGPADNGTYTLTGSAVGNVMFVSGSINGQAMTLFGYFDNAGAYTGMTNSLLVFDYGTLAKVGLLLKQ